VHCLLSSARFLLQYRMRGVCTDGSYPVLVASWLDSQLQSRCLHTPVYHVGSMLFRASLVQFGTLMLHNLHVLFTRLTFCLRRRECCYKHACTGNSQACCLPSSCIATSSTFLYTMVYSTALCCAVLSCPVPHCNVGTAVTSTHA
jgi:hypothetical protein